MRDDEAKMEKIIDCIGKIERYTAEGKNTFLEDDQIQDAVMRNFQVIGEAVKDLSEELRKHNSDVPWRDVARFRDRVTHDYFDVDMGKVWGIIENDLPSFKTQIDQIRSTYNRA